MNLAEGIEIGMVYATRLDKMTIEHMLMKLILNTVFTIARTIKDSLTVARWVGKVWSK